MFERELDQLMITVRFLQPRNCLEMPKFKKDIIPLLQALKNLTQIPEAGLLNKSSCFAQGLGVTKFTNMRGMILITLCNAT